MLSVCIPIYNQDVRDLVNTLHQQVQRLDETCEIVLIDDKSDDCYREINGEVCRNEIYIELSQNIGRSRIRNLFLKYARYNYLLFLDCDAKILNNDFLQKYLDVFKNNQDVKVVCGGWRYSEKKPDRLERLRWLYGQKRESRSVEQRRENPGKSFMSGNFLISKGTLTKYPFDERLSEYGHEDTLLGYTLKSNGVSIHHIENSPVNGGKPEDNSDFLKKTEISIANLSQILKYVQYDHQFIEDLSLLRVYKKVRKFEWIFKVTFWLTKPVVFALLTKGFGSVWLFDFYKMGFFVRKTPSEVLKRIR